MPLSRHRSQTLGMLVLNLVSMFRGHSKLTIGTKINIIRGFILKILGVVTTPSLVVCVPKKKLGGTRVKVSCHLADQSDYYPDPHVMLTIFSLSLTLVERPWCHLQVYITTKTFGRSLM